MANDLNPEKALIFRIAHRENVAWILENGLHCRNSGFADPNFVSIGNPELIERRLHRQVPIAPGGTLGDYIPFYFTPFSPMMLNIKTGYGGIRQRTNEEIVIFVSSLHRLREEGVEFVFTDRHAYLQAAEFSADLGDLDRIDWEILQKRDFRRDDNDLGKVERYQAEALVFQTLPINSLLGVCCYDSNTLEAVEQETTARGLDLKIVQRES